MAVATRCLASPATKAALGRNVAVAVFFLLLTGAVCQQSVANSIDTTPQGAAVGGTTRSTPPATGLTTTFPPPVRVITAEEFEREFGAPLPGDSTDSIKVQTPSSKSSPSSSASGSKKQDVELGLIVGVVLAAVLFAAVAVAIFMHYRKKGDRDEKVQPVDPRLQRFAEV